MAGISLGTIEPIIIKSVDHPATKPYIYTLTTEWAELIANIILEMNLAVGKMNSIKSESSYNAKDYMIYINRFKNEVDENIKPIVHKIIIEAGRILDNEPSLSEFWKQCHSVLPLSTDKLGILGNLAINHGKAYYSIILCS